MAEKYALKFSMGQAWQTMVVFLVFVLFAPGSSARDPGEVEKNVSLPLTGPRLANEDPMNEKIRASQHLQCGYF